MPETTDPTRISFTGANDESGDRIAAWLCVFLANLPLPLLYGIDAVHGGGYWGMGLAIGLLWLVGHLACHRSTVIAWSMLVGGAMIALCQFVPIPQMMAGLVGVRAAGIRMAPLQEQSATDWQGFVATFVTGGLLMTLALFIGLFSTVLAAAAKRSQGTVS